MTRPVYVSSLNARRFSGKGTGTHCNRRCTCRFYRRRLLLGVFSVCTSEQVDVTNLKGWVRPPSRAGTHHDYGSHAFDILSRIACLLAC